MEPSVMHRLLLALLIAGTLGLAACGEKPPRTLPKGEGAAYNNSDGGESLIRERTINQSSERMNN